MGNEIDPLTPPDCDLRGFMFMPLDVGRLLDSELFLTANGEEFKSAVALWCKSWTQVPAASLPDNDKLLAIYSGANGKWKRVRKVALHGWVKASDGRLYHPVVADKAREAWAKKEMQRHKANKRWGNATAHAAGDAAADATVMQGIGIGIGRGNRIKERARSLGERPPAAARSRSGPDDQGEGSPMTRAHTKSLLSRALIPRGDKQVDEWVVLLRDWAGCTSTDQATVCFAWIVGRDDSIQYADAARDLALRWRKDHAVDRLANGSGTLPQDQGSTHARIPLEVDMAAAGKEKAP